MSEKLPNCYGKYEPVKNKCETCKHIGGCGIYTARVTSQLSLCVEATKEATK